MQHKNNFKKYYAIGLMSGTSLDGLDISYSYFSVKEGKWKFELLNTKAIIYSSEMRDKLRSTIDMSALEISYFDIEYGKFLAEEVDAFIKEYNIEVVDVIGSHGHTVFHQPDKGLTLQIGDASWIHKKVKKIVVSDFRSQDVILGGQGAPLVPIGDRLLFSNYDFRINIGGFANVSYEDRGKTVAFDICAVNTVLNRYANILGFEYDDNGEISKSGKLIEGLLQELESIPFYEKEPPKSLGVEWNEEMLLPILNRYLNERIEDVMYTYTQHVARRVSTVIMGDKNKKVLISGGGAFNGFLISLIKGSTESNVIIEDKYITDFKESIIFSFLAVLKLRDEVNCLSEVTGACKDHSSGVIYDYM